MKKILPIGTQSFEKLRNNNCIYVDKTEYLYKLITEGSVYFLSRPRRFGKSLTLTTLEAIFRNKKELFKDLWIEKSDYKWQEYPIIKIDMGEIAKNSDEVLEQSLSIKLEQIAKTYNLELLQIAPLSQKFIDLILKLRNKYNQKVVVLIDEYDKPILDNIDNLELAQKIREILKSFYTILKVQDENIKFILLTGVSKFSKTGIFSGLNNLLDISMNSKYSGLCGYTEEELKENFKEYLKEFAEKHNKTEEKILEEIRYWYNGFRFTSAETKVYNPFSTLLMFNEKEFKYYWFETGTPTFLIKLVKQKNYNIFQDEEINLPESGFSVYEIETLDLIPILYQTGYLTIKNVVSQEGTTIYTLAYPNKEVEIALTKNLIAGTINRDLSIVGSELLELLTTLVNKDMDKFFEALQSFIASIPYNLRIKKEEEKYYQGLLYTILRCLGLKIETEIQTNKGRIDVVIQLSKKIYIMEFKLDGTKEEALNQIKEKKYYEPYLNFKKEIILVGVNFSRQERNAVDWVYEGLN